MPRIINKVWAVAAAYSTQSSYDCAIIPLDLGWLGSHFDYIPYLADLLRVSSKPRLRPPPYGIGVTLGIRFYCGRNSAALLGLSLTIIGTLSCGFIALNESSLSDQYGFISNGWQVIVAVSLILLTLEMARRAVSWPLPLITFLFFFMGSLAITSRVNLDTLASRLTAF